MRVFVSLALLALPLAACSTVSETIRGPELSAVGYPAALRPQEQVYLQPASTTVPAASSNSLWRAGARAFFADQRARSVGDILTVQIEINDRASVSNSTSRSRQSGASVGVPNLLGLESSLGRILPGGFDPANAVGVNSDVSSEGNGSVDRAERLSLTIAAVVTAVMPNGNLVIQGRQEVRTNQELRELTVAGLVRPEDITSSNTIRHTQIAEARISYGGRGSLTRMNQVPAGQSLVERFSPF